MIVLGFSCLFGYVLVCCVLVGCLLFCFVLLRSTCLSSVWCLLFSCYNWLLICHVGCALSRYFVVCCLVLCLLLLVFVGLRLITCVYCCFGGVSCLSFLFGMFSVVVNLNVLLMLFECLVWICLQSGVFYLSNSVDCIVYFFWVIGFYGLWSGLIWILLFVDLFAMMFCFACVIVLCLLCLLCCVWFGLVTSLRCSLYVCCVLLTCCWVTFWLAVDCLLVFWFAVCVRSIGCCFTCCVYCLLSSYYNSVVYNLFFCFNVSDCFSYVS